MKFSGNLAEQILWLQQCGLQVDDYAVAHQFLNNVNIQRLAGFWKDFTFQGNELEFRPGVCFNDVIKIYEFDRRLRIVLFDAIERIEIAFRTRLINILTNEHGTHWYLNENLFSQSLIKMGFNTFKSTHTYLIDHLVREFNRKSHSMYSFHYYFREAGGIHAHVLLETSSLGALSKLYKNLNHQLKEKSQLANSFGLTLHSELSSWLESITYLRNIIAHHDRLWDRKMVKMPRAKLRNPRKPWFDRPLSDEQCHKPFLNISCVVYLLESISPEAITKRQIIELLNDSENMPIERLGFDNDWEKQPLWQL